MSAVFSPHLLLEDDSTVPLILGLLLLFRFFLGWLSSLHLMVYKLKFQPLQFPCLQFKGRMSSLVSKKNMDDHIAIERLTRETNNPAIKVRVSRLWDAYNLKNKKELISTDMVLIDDEGSYIHASIKGSWAHLFRGSVVEGSVYYIKHFAVVDNKPRYRVVGDQKLMLQLYANSTIIPIPGDTSCIPRHRFDLVSFDNVETRLGQDYILTDVVGRVCSEGDIVLKAIHNRMVPCLMLELQDLREAKMRMTLWDESVEDYMNQKKAIQGRVIAGVFTSNLVKQFMIYLNIDIDEIQALKTERFNEYTITPLMAQRQGIDKATVLARMKTIDDLLHIAASDFEDGTSYYTHAVIYDINNNTGWYYNSCEKCKHLIKACGEKFWCNKCEKIVDDAVPRYRLDVGVKDENACTRFIIFDDEAEKIIGQSAMSVYDIEDKTEEDELAGNMPSLIANIIGRPYVFRVKLTEYNKSAYTQSFTATKVLPESILESNDITQTQECNDGGNNCEQHIIDESPAKKRRFSDDITQRVEKAVEE